MCYNEGKADLIHRELKIENIFTKCGETLMGIDAVIFDLGGTLINYEGLALCWGDYYKYAFENVKEKLKIDLSEKQIYESIQILKRYNPRLYPREIEYDPEDIFSSVKSGWGVKGKDIAYIINSFFSYFRRNVIVYKDVYEVLPWLKENNYKIGILTDLPTGMPDGLIREDISSFEEMIDCYVSSVTCGYRKPNKSGLNMLSKLLNVPIDNMIFIGDEEKDIKTSQNAGCKSALINRRSEHNNFGQDYEINSLTEIFEVLR